MLRSNSCWGRQMDADAASSWTFRHTMSLAGRSLHPSQQGFPDPPRTMSVFLSCIPLLVGAHLGYKLPVSFKRSSPQLCSAKTAKLPAYWFSGENGPEFSQDPRLEPPHVFFVWKIMFHPHCATALRTPYHYLLTFS